MQLNSILKKRLNWKDISSFQTINNINRLSPTSWVAVFAGITLEEIEILRLFFHYHKKTR